MKDKWIYLFWFSIIAGLFLKVLSLFFNGMHDMSTYYDWGLNNLNAGLYTSYHGIYFPIQYQLFEFCAWLSIQLNIESYIPFKVMNLLFDAGNMIVLYLLLRRMGISIYYTLLYWLHPWFLNVFSLGYIDFQFTFFVLVCLYFSLNSTVKYYLLSSLFLGIAFLMKPQSQIIVLSFGVYGLFELFKTKNIKFFLLFTFPIIFFLLYSLYFTDHSTGVWRLAHHYTNVVNIMPCLNANFLNGWFIVAYLIKGVNDPIYSISDKITVFDIQLKYFAIFFVLIIIVLFIKLLRDNNTQTGKRFDLLLITFVSSTIVPFIMTSAHENHLFLATVLVIPMMGIFKNIMVKVCLNIILILQWINLYGYYGIGDIKWRIIYYSYDVAFVLSIIACLCFCLVLFHMLNPRSKFFGDLKSRTS